MISNNQISSNRFPTYMNNQSAKKIQKYVFKLNDAIGQGNFSQVYKGIDQTTRQVVAIKVVELTKIHTPALMQLLDSEIEILKQLRHPNILNCIDVFTTINNCYIITQYCNEGDLESKIRYRGRMSENQITKIVYDIYLGLKYLAQNGIIHRDLKIANILFHNSTAKIADFGFAKKTRQKFKDINIGSPIYMSPEGLINNIYGPKTDVWAFGILIYQILHANTPLGFCKTEAQLRNHILTPIQRQRIDPNLSNQLKQLILRCLQIDQRKRISMLQIQNTQYMKRIFKEMINMQENLKLNNGQNFYSIVSTQIGIQNPIKFNQPIIHNSQRSKDVIDQIKQFSNIKEEISKSPFIQQQKLNKSFNNKLKNKSVQKPQKLNLVSLKFEQKKKNQTLNLNHYSGSSNNLNPNDSSNLIPSRKKIISLGRINQIQIEKSKNDSNSTKTLQINSIISFKQCVQILHYCRLVYKIVILLNQSNTVLNNNAKIKNIYAYWLLNSFDDIHSKVPKNIKFEGQKAQIRQKKLIQVLNQYHKKYHSQILLKEYCPTNFRLIQQTTQNLLKNIEGILSQKIIIQQKQQKKLLIVLSHYLFCLYQTNIVLEKCCYLNDYSQFMKTCNIQIFLSFKNEYYNEQTYANLKAKMKLTI